MTLDDHLGRRDFLRMAGIALAASALPLHLLGAPAARAKTAPGKFDISYLWHPDIDAVLEYMEAIDGILGPDVERNLTVVRGGRNYGLIYERDGTRESALKVADVHSRILKEAGLDAAAIIEHEGYSKVYNISYGLGPNLDALKRDFGTVTKMLGPDVGKNLVIERTDSGNYALVYKRRGDLDETIERAAQHARILEGTGIGAAHIVENNNDLVYGESTHISETEKPQPVRRVPPAQRREAEKKRPKRGIFESNLERAVERYVDQRRRTVCGKITTAWSVYDLTRGEKLVSINEDVPMQCASMMKPFVALAYFHEVAAGRLSYNASARKHMTRMIQSSNNVSTTWLMKRIGKPSRTQRILKDGYGEIFEDTKIVEYIPQNGQTYRNKASAHDYSRFMFALYQGDLPYSKEILRLMRLPKTHGNRIYQNRRSKIPRGTICEDKTGYTGHVNGDYGILRPMGKDGKRYPYIIVGIVQDAYEKGHVKGQGTSLIAGVSNLVYEHMKRRHDLR